MMRKWMSLLCAAVLLLTGCQGGGQEESGVESSTVLMESSQIVEESSESSEESSEISDAEASQENSEESSEAVSEEQILLARAQEVLSGMTLEEKVGQMFLARMPSSAEYYAEEYQLGGYVLFDVDFEGYTQEQVINRIDGCQAVSKIPMLMAVDEEGGTVTRVSDYFRDSVFASPRDVYAEGGWAGIVSDTAEKCQLLQSMHLNMNLAPVCDLAEDPSDFMYDRSFSGNAQEAANFVGWTISTMKEYGMAASLKHFPGYGNNLDTHTGMSIDYRDASVYYENDLVPFEAGIKAGAESVMVSHNIVTCFDEEYPASLSPEIHRILREDLGFDGVVITDDLVMGAILEYCDEVNAAVLAVEAGNDMLIASDLVDQYASIMSAIEEGRITEERINESVLRILTLKLKIGLME